MTADFLPAKKLNPFMEKIICAMLLLCGLATGVQSLHAVDGLQIQIHQQTNILLRWPSIPGQTFLIVHTDSLAEPIKWQALATGYAASSTTNETTFIHYSQIPEPPEPETLMQSEGSGNVLVGPLVAKPSQSSKPVPLCLYPKGFDLSGHVIIWPDGTTTNWSKELSDAYESSKSAQMNDWQLENYNEEFTAASCGFYRVLGVQVLEGLTNNATLSDFMPLITTRPDQGVKYLRLLVNGEPLPAQGAIFPPFTNAPSFEWVDTARISNGGPYTIQVEAVYQLDSIFSSGLHHTLSQPFQISIFNDLSFPAWDDLTEDEVCGFDIVSAEPNVDWQIDVYDVFEYIDWLNGVILEIYPIHSMTGVTTNGVIQYDWDFLDDYNVWRNDPWHDPYFISFTYTSWGASSQFQGGGETPQGSGGSAATMNPVKRQPAKWPQQGHWVVAWQDMFRHLYDQNNYLKSAFTNILLMANLPESDVPAAAPFWQPPTGGTNAQTFPIRHFYSAFRTDLNPTNSEFFQSTIYDESLFVQMLRDTRARNLFYSGHGSPEWIVKTVFAPLLKEYNIHRYRFVWLDGCETGGGSWSDSFGIPGPGTFAIEYYRERTKRPALFVGNKYSVPMAVPGERIEGGVLYDGTIPRSYSEFYNQFIFWWQTMGREYRVAVENARTQVQSAYPTPRMQYVDGPKAGEDYWPGDDQFRVGYEDLKFNVYNKYYDIPRP